MALEQLDQTTWRFEPGLADAHSHPRVFDPITEDRFVEANGGYEGKSGLEVYTKVALLSGFTVCMAMPNESLRIRDPSAQSPERTILLPYPISNIDRVRAMQAAIINEALVPTAVYTGLDPTEIFLESNPQNLNEDLLRQRFASVSGECIGLKVYLAETTGGYNIDKRYAARVAQLWHEYNPERPVVMHVEGEDVAEVLQSINALPEGKAIPLHLAHVSSQVELQAKIDARAAGMDVSCEATIHHLLLDRSDKAELGAYAEVKPSLKRSEDVDFLRAHLNDIDLFATDGAPHRNSDKKGPTPMAGITNHDSWVPLLLGAVANGWLTMDQLYDKLSVKPRQRFNLPRDDGSFTEVSTDLSQRAPYSQTEYMKSPFVRLRPGFEPGGRVIAVAAGVSTYDGYDLKARNSHQHLIRPKNIGELVVGRLDRQYTTIA